MAEESIEKPETQLCDQDGCKAVAELAYAWDWGKRGVCCPDHAALLQQLAPQINRTVTVYPLPSAAVPSAPLQRDERVRLQAEILVLQAELEEAKGRGLDLFRENTKLAQQVQLLTVRERELKAQLKDADAHSDDLEQRLASRDVEHGELIGEIDRLRTLERLLPGNAGVAG